MYLFNYLTSSTTDRAHLPKHAATTLTILVTGWVVLYWLLFSQPASARTLSIDDNIDQVAASTYLSLLEDPGRELTIEQITSPTYQNQFTPHSAEQLNLGHNLSYWWLKLEVEQHTSQSWYALIDFVALSRVDAYLQPATADDIHYLGNMRKEFTFQRLPMVQLPELPDTKRFTLYLKVENHGYEVLWLPVQLLSADALYKKIAKDYLFYGGILLGLMILIPYHLFLYFSLRNSSYLALVFFLVSLVLILQRTNNIIPWLSPFSNPASYFYPLSFQLVGISGVQFWRQLTDSGKLFPRLNQAISITLLLMIIQIPFLRVMPYPCSWTYGMTALLIFAVDCFSLLALHKQSRAMLNFSLAFFIFTSSAIPTLLWGMGFLEAVTIPVKVFHVGSLLFAILFSITLAEHTRQLRIQAEHAKAESSAKDNFLTTMSHELRTPMYTVTSVVQLLKTTALSAKQSTYLSKLETSADHMLTLINKVLDLARINSHEFDLEHTPFQLEELLRQVELLLIDEATQKNLQLTIENKLADPQLALIGDPTRLKQILLNLLHNAIKFTERGSVSLSVEGVSSSCLPTSTTRLTFHITDTGAGIPEEQCQMIFQSFSQGDSSTARKYGGSGLGLAISYKLIKQMGGELELTSTLGQGSCFFFTLELSEHTGAVSPTSSLSPLPTNADTNTPEASRADDQSIANIPAQITAEITVLLIDDVQLNRFLGRELLRTLGVNTITADSGKAALQVLQHHTHPTIDLVFMDVSMPEMDGYETTRHIRSEPQFAELPIIALTAHAIEGERERCLAAGMDDYLSKPFALTQLQEKLQRWSKPAT